MADRTHHLVVPGQRVIVDYRTTAGVKRRCWGPVVADRYPDSVLAVNDDSFGVLRLPWAQVDEVTPL